MTTDNRMTGALIIDVLGVLEQHGYHRRDDQHTSQAIATIVDLASIYEGTRDAYPGQAPLPPPQPATEADQDSVILTDAEVTTVVTALDLAADYKRDRAATCANCADQSCLDCQSRLQDAQAYDQMAADILRTAEAAREADAIQPEPGSRAIAPAQAVSVADREAGL